jgi:hypothetical protein
MNADVASDEFKAANSFLKEFEYAVKTNQPHLVAEYFVEDIKSYGSVNEVLQNFAELQSRQWGTVWNVVADWKITNIDRLDVSPNHFACAFRWWRLNKDGQVLNGRSTIYGRFIDSQLQVEHTHFSILNTG